MASDLYEVLGIDRSASPEDIRKAYKKKALATHPDRLPPNTSEDEKQNANERFRLVNNAYEVLNDPNNRKLYDQHGVWPPPTATEQPPAHNASYSRDPFGSSFGGDPFFARRRPMHGFVFTDPFELFNSLFGDLHRAFDHDPFHNEFPMPRSPFDLMFGPSPRRSHSEDFFGHSAMSPFGLGLPFGGEHPLVEMMNGGMGGTRSHRSVSQTFGSGGQWVSESTMVRTINGRTETIVKRRDAQGNEHATYSSPEGERHTVNGIEQPAHSDRYLPQSGPHRSATSPSPLATSRHDHSQAQQIPINVVPSPPAGYTAPPQAEPSTRLHSSSRQRHHSTHEGVATRVRAEDDGVRRSSSSRMHAERGKGEAAYQDPTQYYDTTVPRRSSSSRHSHHSHHSHDRVPYSEPPQQVHRTTPGVSNVYRHQSAPYADPMPDPGAKYSPDNLSRHATNAYVDPQLRSAYAHSSHSRHSHDRDDRHRYGDAERRDEHHRRKWWNGAHGW